MLGRYKLFRGAPPAGTIKPAGVRQLTTHNSRHCLRPTAEIVAAYLDDPGDAAWVQFEAAYLALVRARFAEDRTPFDTLAELASREDVHLGCWCPTKANPDVRRCHTWPALAFMAEQYPDLDVRFPHVT